MAEPLKDKRLWMHKGDTITQGGEKSECIKEVSYFKESNVKSAVEWLKAREKDIEEHFKNSFYDTDEAMVEEIFRRFREKIDQAFPDIVKKE